MSLAFKKNTHIKYYIPVLKEQQTKISSCTDMQKASPLVRKAVSQLMNINKCWGEAGKNFMETISEDCIGITFSVNI